MSACSRPFSRASPPATTIDSTRFWCRRSAGSTSRIASGRPSRDATDPPPPTASPSHGRPSASTYAAVAASQNNTATFGSCSAVWMARWTPFTDGRSARRSTRSATDDRAMPRRRTATRKATGVTRAATPAAMRSASDNGGDGTSNTTK